VCNASRLVGVSAADITRRRAIPEQIGLSQLFKMFNIIRFTPSNTWYYPASVELGNLANTKLYVPHTEIHIPLGASRVGGPAWDVPALFAPPSDMQFAAQLKLEDFSAFDSGNLLPRSGFLYFFIGGYGNEGKVIFADCATSDLECKIIEHEKWFWDGSLIENIFAEAESLESRYVDGPGHEKEWDDFAGVEKSKIYGIYTHCQMDEKEILSITNSSRLLLLQIGEDFTGEGVWSVLIEKADLKNRDFSCCTFEWGQS